MHVQHAKKKKQHLDAYLGTMVSVSGRLKLIKRTKRCHLNSAKPKKKHWTSALKYNNQHNEWQIVPQIHLLFSFRAEGCPDTCNPPETHFIATATAFGGFVYCRGLLFQTNSARIEKHINLHVYTNMCICCTDLPASSKKHIFDWNQISTCGFTGSPRLSLPNCLMMWLYNMMVWMLTMTIVINSDVC